jgi:hypothetical protein
MQAIEITCSHCGMTGAQVRQARAEGLDLGVERIAVDPAVLQYAVHPRLRGGCPRLFRQTPEKHALPSTLISGGTVKTPSATPAATRRRTATHNQRLTLLSFPPRLWDGSLLTPPRMRELHAQLDELFRIRDAGIYIGGMIELAWRHEFRRDANDGANDGEAPA